MPRQRQARKVEWAAWCCATGAAHSGCPVPPSAVSGRDLLPSREHHTRWTLADCPKVASKHNDSAVHMVRGHCQSAAYWVPALAERTSGSHQAPARIRDVTIILNPKLSSYEYNE
ncbi:hypothetical protein NJB1507_35930 [Mycobacterium marinum]|nr:hypothetical protein NJB1507_35930 [Mycobacterium marinum]